MYWSHGPQALTRPRFCIQCFTSGECYLPGWMSGVGRVSDLVSQWASVRVWWIFPVYDQLCLDGLDMWQVEWRTWLHCGNKQIMRQMEAHLNSMLFPAESIDIKQMNHNHNATLSLLSYQFTFYQRLLNPMNHYNSWTQNQKSTFVTLQN